MASSRRLLGVATIGLLAASCTAPSSGGHAEPERCLSPGPLADLSGCHFSGRDLRGVDWHGANLEGATLDSVDLTGADLTAVSASRASFRDANLTAADLDSAVLVDTRFDDGADGDTVGTVLNGATLRHSRLDGTNLTNARITGTDFSFSHAEETTFTGATIVRGYRDLGPPVGANFYAAEMELANFDDSELGIGPGVASNFSLADLTDVMFRSVAAGGVNLSGAITTGWQTAGSNLADVVVEQPTPTPPAGAPGQHPAAPAPIDLFIAGNSFAVVLAHSGSTNSYGWFPFPDMSFGFPIGGYTPEGVLRDRLATLGIGYGSATKHEYAFSGSTADDWRNQMQTGGDGTFIRYATMRSEIAAASRPVVYFAIGNNDGPFRYGSTIPLTDSQTWAQKASGVTDDVAELALDLETANPEVEIVIGSYLNLNLEAGSVAIAGISCPTLFSLGLTATPPQHRTSSVLYAAYLRPLYAGLQTVDDTDDHVIFANASTAGSTMASPADPTRPGLLLDCVHPSRAGLDRYVSGFLNAWLPRSRYLAG